MVFIIASDYYADYEVISAPTKGDAEVYIIDMLNHNEPDSCIEILGSSEKDGLFDLNDWQAKADDTLFISDYETE